MGRHKSVYQSGQTPIFKYYKIRKTYFSNASRYVTHEEIRNIIAESDGNFDLHGEIDKEKFLMKILTVSSGKDVTDVLYRAIKNGGFVSYIKQLEGNMETVNHVSDTVNQLI
jgi:hypothetical protein